MRIPLIAAFSAALALPAAAAERPATLEGTHWTDADVTSLHVRDGKWTLTYPLTVREGVSLQVTHQLPAGTVMIKEISPSATGGAPPTFTAKCLVLGTQDYVPCRMTVHLTGLSIRATNAADARRIHQTPTLYLTGCRETWCAR